MTGLNTFADASGSIDASELDDNFAYLAELIAQISTSGARGTMNFVEVEGSPFTLTGSWAPVATVTAAARALIVGDTAEGVAQHDIFWTSVPSGGEAPGAGVKGLPVGQVEHFLAGIPLGDIYLRSDSGATATVQVGS